jgi:cell division protein FtsB
MKRRFQLRLPRPRLPALSEDWHVRVGMIIVGLILTSLTVYFVFQFVSLVWQGKQQEQEIARGQTAIALQQEQNRRLKEELEYAESDAYVEKMARERLGMARDGEVILIPEIVVRTQTPLPAVARQPAAPAPAGVSNWRRWLAALSGD